MTDNCELSIAEWIRNIAGTALFCAFLLGVCYTRDWSSTVVCVHATPVEVSLQGGVARIKGRIDFSDGTSVTVPMKLDRYEYGVDMSDDRKITVSLIMRDNGCFTVTHYGSTVGRGCKPNTRI